MKILFLGPKGFAQNQIVRFLGKKGNDIFLEENKFTYKDIEKSYFDYLISFGYRHILNKEIINHFNERALNLHISFLPWNKGADPNIWSILENTPKGVTIHLIDEGIDTGKILCQKEIEFDDDDTLKTSYYKLLDGMVLLFKSNWEKIILNEITPREQKGIGSYHKVSDKEIYIDLINKGFETKIINLIGKGLKND